MICIASTLSLASQDKASKDKSIYMLIDYQEERLTITKILIKDFPYWNYGDVTDIGFKFTITDQENTEIYAQQFRVPQVKHIDYFDPEGGIQGDVEILKKATFHINIPYFEEANEMVFYKDGEVIYTFNIKKVIDNQEEYYFPSSSPRKDIYVDDNKNKDIESSLNSNEDYDIEKLNSEKKNQIKELNKVINVIFVLILIGLIIVAIFTYGKKKKFPKR